MGSSVSTEAFDFDAQLLADKNIYAKPVAEGSKDPNATAAYRNVESYDKLLDEPLGSDNVWGIWQGAVKKHADINAFGTRTYIPVEGTEGADRKLKERGEYKWITYDRANTKAVAIGAGLVSLGVQPQQAVGIFALNRAEWVLTALGCYSQKLRVVALYDTLGDSAVEFIVNHAELSVVCVSMETLPKILGSLDKFKQLKHIVMFDEDADFGNWTDKISEADIATAKEHGVELLGITELSKRGEEAGTSPAEVHGDDIAIIMYTSGTTGTPKGVLLPHAAIAAASGGVPGLNLSPGDSYLSFLPLAHIFETVVQAFCWDHGVSIGFFQGNPKKLINDFGSVQPALVAAVPRVYQRMYQKVMDGVKDKSCILRFVFGKAYAEQGAAVREGRRIQRWDDKVFKKVKDTIGMTKTKCLITGAAPCPPYLLEFLKIVIGCQVVQGYGLTETAAGLCVNYPTDITIGHVGPPTRWAEVRLKSVEEMGYLVTDPLPRGEIQVRGKGVFTGYYKNEDATKEAFDDGWFCTGDVGRWNPNGTLSIIDRKKNIFKLGQGEYIAVEKIESVYGQSTLVGQMFVYGNSFKNQLVAVAVPSMENFSKIAQDKGYWKVNAPLGSTECIAEFQRVWKEHSAELEAILIADMKKNESQLKGFEKVAKFYFDTDVNELGLAFTVENDCMTPTFKLRRPFLLKKYLDIIKQMYTDLGDAPKPDERW